MRSFRVYDVGGVSTSMPKADKASALRSISIKIISVLTNAFTETIVQGARPPRLPFVHQVMDDANLSIIHPNIKLHFPQTHQC